MAARPSFYLPPTLQKPRGGDALRPRPGAFLFKLFPSPQGLTYRWGLAVYPPPYSTVRYRVSPPLSSFT